MMWCRTALAGAVLALGLSTGAPSQDPAAVRVEGRDEREPSVGMRACIEDIVLEGSELKAKPAEDLDAPIVLRVRAARVHGTAFRYDLEYYGLDPGRFDLRDYLVRADGSSTAGLPAIPVDIQPLLPAGQVEPHPLMPRKVPEVGGYRTLVTLAIVAWVVGLLAILWLGRRKRLLAAEQAEVVVTLADRLRPAVEAARRGDLDESGKAELERLLLAYWRRRLGLGEQKASRAMTQLRSHAEAGPLLRQLEVWLHQPGPGGDDVDVALLLEPYRDTPADFDRRVTRPAEVS